MATQCLNESTEQHMNESYKSNGFEISSSIQRGEAIYVPFNRIVCWVIGKHFFACVSVTQCTRASSAGGELTLIGS